jgi:CRP/FNR family transcriptional regulator, cyclic AMP receptor protein
MRTLDELIADAPVFAGLAPSALRLIAGCAHNEHVDPGTMLFREREPAGRFFLVRKGAVALEIAAPGRDALVIATLHDGEVVGWSWLFPPYRWHFDGRATVSTELVVVDGACLRGKCDADHELGYQLMRRFAAAIEERLQATRLQLLDVYGHALAG